ncbi:aspartate carbamoyltransferase [Candidatus Pacearchaeota archaeon]|nr:aspartate carbamoyltransferase [Candidatus Pacearchaeota archaeon]
MVYHVVESQQFDPETLQYLFKRADELRETPELCLKGKILTSLFYESSTRTRLSFESAMIRLGGMVIGTENAREFSSVAKGESLEDSVRVISSYCDVIVLRHDEDGAAKRAAEACDMVPIINGGDGKGQHPTQALLDVYTIYREFGKLDNLKMAMVGDLANGRTVRSLCYLLGKFDDIKIIFVSPDHLKMKEDIRDYLDKKRIIFREEEDLNKVLSEVDVVYMTRIQRERMSDKDYEKAKGKFIINVGNFHLIRKDARIFHPLPHVEEIDLPINIENNDKRVAYFRQAENGLYVRMALLDFVINSN